MNSSLLNRRVRDAGLSGKRTDMYKSSPNNRKGGAAPSADYTSDSNGNESPSWRNVYKKRCFDEFKKSRQKLVNRFRSLDVGAKDTKVTAKDYLEAELEKICLFEANTQPELKISPDEAMEILKQIQNELIPSGEFSDEQLSEILYQEELKEIINNETIQNNSEIYVVCPLCQKNNLIMNGEDVVCRNSVNCTFKMEKSLNLSLNGLSDRLETATGMHDCNNVPSFQFKNDVMENSEEAKVLKQMSGSTHSSFLLMSCEKCNFMEFIF